MQPAAHDLRGGERHRRPGSRVRSPRAASPRTRAQPRGSPPSRGCVRGRGDARVVRSRRKRAVRFTRNARVPRGDAVASRARAQGKPARARAGVPPRGPEETPPAQDPGRAGGFARRASGGGGARRRGVGVAAGASARVSGAHAQLLFARRRGAMQRRVVRLGDVAVVEHVAQPLDEPARGGEHGPRLGPAGRLAHERRGR
mmetsp:Transcript_15979/g.67346  ORF Transcript_15979/g.67346 Transcript_15979/m.67346 type:complete len:201 (-) Transcript_15979:332-934(-)